MHVDPTILIRKCRPQASFTGGDTSLHFNRAIRPNGYLLKTTRPEIESDVECVCANFSSFDFVKNPLGIKSRMIILPETSADLKLNFKARLSSYIGRERRKRVSQVTWCGAGCFESRRRVNGRMLGIVRTVF